MPGQDPPPAGALNPLPAADDGFDALVLAGGQARRLGGVDKPALVVGERSLLDTVLLACAAADRTVVVGPERATCRPVTWAREEPAGSGPAAAVGAGLWHVTQPHFVLLAADLPFLGTDTVALLLTTLGRERDADGVLLVDDTGRDQLLCSAWRTAAVRSAVTSAVARRVDATVESAVPAGPLEGASLRSLLGPLVAVRLSAPALPGRPAAWTDCDTPADLERARGSG